jgi:hypothetical protein
MLPRLTTTVAGQGYFPHQIRNIIRAEEDARLWPGKKNISNLNILALDAGQAFPIGMYRYLSKGLIEGDKGKEKTNLEAAIRRVTM